MNETVKTWLLELLDDTIREVKGTIENERIWANGSDTDEEIGMHCENINLNEEYIKVLEEIKEKYV